jgi:TPR repeat protein
VTRTLAALACLALVAACCGGHRATTPPPGGAIPPDAPVASAPAWRCAADACTLAELERGCADRVPEACNLLGGAYARGQIVAKDLLRAATLWDDACTSGLGRACFNLAGARGLDHPAAWLAAMTRGCELRDGLACQSIGEAYAHGQLGGVDEVRSAEHYQRACELERADACLVLAEAYRAGRGVAADAARADTLVARACTLRPEHAQCARRP